MNIWNAHFHGVCCNVCWNKHEFLWLQIGNPLLEFNTDFNSRAEFFWSHGLISDDTYEIFTTVCNYSQIRRQYQSGSLSLPCSAVNSQVSREVSKYVDAYDVTLDVCLSSIESQSQVLKQMVSSCLFSFRSYIILPELKWICLIRLFHGLLCRNIQGQ